jgi:hypothetical protein
MTDGQRPEKPWFRPKLIGYGFTPNTWQGWLITFFGAAKVAAIILSINHFVR